MITDQMFAGSAAVRTQRMPFSHLRSWFSVAAGAFRKMKAENNFNGGRGVELGACGFRWKTRHRIGGAFGNAALMKAPRL